MPASFAAGYLFLTVRDRLVKRCVISALEGQAASCGKQGVRGVRDDLLLVDRQLAADCLCGVEGGTQRVHGIIREITDIRAVELRLRIGNGSVESGIIGALEGQACERVVDSLCGGVNGRLIGDVLACLNGGGGKIRIAEGFCGCAGIILEVGGFDLRFCSGNSSVKRIVACREPSEGR